MQSLFRSKSAGVTGGRGTAGAGSGRDLRYYLPDETAIGLEDQWWGSREGSGNPNWKR